MGFSRQEYWSGLPFPPLGDLPDLGTEPVSPALAGGFFTTEKTTFALKEGNFKISSAQTPRACLLATRGQVCYGFSEGPVFEEGQWQKPGQGLPPGCS